MCVCVCVLKAVFRVWFRFFFFCLMAYQPLGLLYTKAILGEEQLSESESNSATGVRTHLLQGRSPVLYPLRYVNSLDVFRFCIFD